jgi:hypothetical protein
VQAVPAPLPSGAALQGAPAVSADRRHVRIGVNAGFNDVRGFQTFQVPAAVAGGGAGMSGPVGGAGGVGGVAGMMGAGGSGLVGGLGAVGPFGPFGGGAVGMSGFPFAFAVSGGYGPFGGYGPMSGWGDPSWSGQGMGGYGVPGMGGGFGPGMGMGMPGLPGLGEPLIEPGLPGPVREAATADPFDPNRPQAGVRQFPPPVQGRVDRNVPRGRSSRARGGRAPRRQVVPRRGPIAPAPAAAIVPPVLNEDAPPAAAPRQPMP